MQETSISGSYNKATACSFELNFAHRPSMQHIPDMKHALPAEVPYKCRCVQSNEQWCHLMPGRWNDTLCHPFCSGHFTQGKKHAAFLSLKNFLLQSSIATSAYFWTFLDKQESLKIYPKWHHTKCKWHLCHYATGLPQAEASLKSAALIWYIKQHRHVYHCSML